MQGFFFISGAFDDHLTTFGYRNLILSAKKRV